MAWRQPPKHRTTVVGVAIIVAASLTLAGCAASKSSPSSSSGTTPISTQSIPPSSVCGADGDYVHQSLNGDFTDCLRVPALASPSEVVALQAYLLGTTAPTVTTTFAHSSPEGKLSLALSTTNANPGERVTLKGRFLSHAPSLAQRNTHANVCWDGCRSGLEEQGVPVHWTSPTTFSTTLEVPRTAWLTVKSGVVSAHPLLSGNYQVGVQCLDEISGCALGSAQAHTTIHLKAPKPTRCVSGSPCETMRLSPSTAKVGQTVLIRGWAPLQAIIGEPFAYSVSVTPGPAKKRYPPISYFQNQKGGALNVVLTPRVLHVAASPTWASLGHLAYLSSTFAGLSAIAPTATPGVVAWCPSSGVAVTRDSASTQVPTSDVATALRGTGLGLFSSSTSNPSCSTVLLDANHHESVFAGFETAVNDSAPPVYIAALYTTNDGTTWRMVPTPANMSFEDFAGFSSSGTHVEALFARADDYSSRFYPPGSSRGLVSVEVTANGGATWSTSTLGCPNSGPCVTWGPDQWGNCAMDGSPQPLLVGPTSMAETSEVRWRDTFWSSSINSCSSQQLVATSSRELLLLDPSSQYPLVRSVDSGRTWAYVALPRIPAEGYGKDSIPMGNALLFAPNGSLYSVITNFSGTEQDLFALQPGASAWCQVPHVLGTALTSGTVGEMRIDGSDLSWIQTVSSANGELGSRLHVVPLAQLHC